MNQNDFQNQPRRSTNSDAHSAGQTRSLDGNTQDANDAVSPLRKPAEWIGRRLGKYRVDSVIGAGGMGVVLRAHDLSIERDVAIKVLPEELSTSENALGRFRAEAKSAGKLNHPNTVTVYEVGSDGATNYLVMELIEGGSAEEGLREAGPYSVAEATRMTIEALRGVAAAHKFGLVHRDVKPANLMLTTDGAVKVADFGLAKQTTRETLQMTRDGQLVGTPYFMSPEQCESKQVDARSDIYSIGATYYSLLTGKNPYEESGSVIQVMFAHCNTPPPDPRDIRNEVPAACAQVIEHAMAKTPAARYQNAEEMLADLESVQAALSGSARDLPSQSGAVWQPSPHVGQAPPRRAFNYAVGIGALILVGLAAILFATRGGDDNNGEGNPGDGKQGDGGQGPAAVAPPQGEPIRVGVLHSQTGTMAGSETPVIEATLLAINEINQNGGLLGRPVEAIIADGKSDSQVFASESRRLIEQESVVAVFGCWTSASRKTVVPIFQELDHLLIYPVQYEGLEESPNVIYTGAAPNQQILPAVKWAFAFQNKRRFFVVGSDYVFPRVAVEIIRDEIKGLGAELVGEGFVPLGADNTDSLVQEIVDSKPDVILNLINGDTNIAFFRQLRAKGITPQMTPTISFSIGEAEVKQMGLDNLAGDFAAWNYFQSIDSPKNQGFVAAVKQKYGEDRVVTDPMEAAYLGVKLWAQAVSSAKSTETGVVRREMRNQRFDGPGGAVRIDPATQHTFKTPRIGQVESSGQFKIVWTAAEPETPRPYPQSRTTEDWRRLLHDLYTGWGDQWAAPLDAK